MNRAERIMAVVRWLLLAAITALAAYSVYTYWLLGDASHAHREDRYYCPMHPEIRSPEPGECPICHMRLEPIPADRTTPTVASGPSDGGVDAAFAPPPDGLAPLMLTLERTQLVGIATVVAEARVVAPTVRAPGIIEAREGSTTEVRVRAPSFLERVLVRESGARVSAGQVLAYVYSPDVARARDELRVAGAWSEAAADAGVPGASDVTEAGRRGLARLGVDARDLEAALRADDSVPTVPLRAPRGGTVTRFDAPVGRFAMPETVLYEITDLSRVWVVASVPERELEALRGGVPVTFHPDGHGAVRQATFVRVEPEADPNTRAARVRLELANRDHVLRPGQVGVVYFALPSRPGVVVPREAVVDTGRARYVFVDHGGGTFEPRTVEVGERVGDVVAITRGIAAGERVVTRGGFLLDSESRLSASFRRAPAAPSAPPADEHEGHR